jgi:hypothetical protein
MFAGERRRLERRLRRLFSEVSAAFPMPADDDGDDRWEVYALVEDALAGVAGGLPRGGFRTAGYNA